MYAKCPSVSQFFIKLLWCVPKSSPCRYIMLSLNIASILGQILSVTAAAQKFYTVGEHVAGQEIFQT